MSLERKQHEVILDVCEGNGTYNLHFQYLESQMTQWEAANVVDTVGKCLSSLMYENPSAFVGDIDMFSDRDKKQVRGWNKETLRYQPECVHDLFQRQVHSSPDAMAIASWDGNFTYAELDILSSRLAQYLISLGVRPEVLVPISLEKSCWTIVCMMAILKAGGACVPVDFAHPKVRLVSILQRTRAKIVLVAPSTAAKFTALVESVIEVTPAFFQDLPADRSIPLARVRPSNSAFVVFTSGSTGQPKGIVQEHGAFCSGLIDYVAALDLGPSSRVMQFAAYTFDASNNDIFPTLASGGCLCIPSESQRVNDLAGCIRSLEANVIFLTPTVASLLQPNEVPSLEVLALAGEAVTKDNLESWADKVRLINIYGPAEIAIGASYQLRMTRSTVATDIGYPATGRCWIADASDSNRLVPIGSIGELLVEGPHLSRGYLHDEERTQASFGHSYPWGKEVTSDAQQRFYKTGDLAKYSHDGSMVYLGRKDSQIKLRGHRIEVGEVEYCLRKFLPSATGIVVDAIEMPRNNTHREVSKSLVAFICLSSSDTGASEISWQMSQIVSMRLDLERSLAELLPDYMIPTLLIPLTSMPLNASGKTDRRYLQNLTQGLNKQQLSLLAGFTEYTKEPLSKVERTMQQLWASTLRIATASIGRHDSFFRLGGDSVDSMRLVAAARAERLRLTVPEIFRNPTLSAMALIPTPIHQQDLEAARPFTLISGEIDRKLLVSKAAHLCETTDSLIEDIYPCTPIQIGLLSMSSRSEGLYVSQHIIELSQDIDVNRLQAAFMSLLDSTAILRTRVFHVDSKFYQAVIKRAEPFRHAECLSGYFNNNKTDLGLGKSLFHYALIDSMHSSRRYMVWTMHHAIFDAFSLSIMIQKLERIYLKHSPIEKSEFNGFVGFAIRRDQDLAASFWHSNLSGIRPTTFPELPVRSYKPRTDSIDELLVQLSPMARSDVTLATVVQAAWALLLAQRTGDSNVVFGATLTGRDSSFPGVEQVVGPTLATVPILVRLDYESSIAGFLLGIQEQYVSLIDAEHMGLQNISKLSSEAEAACNFQSLLVVQPPVLVQNPGEHQMFRLSTVADMDGETVSMEDLSEAHSYPLVVECSLDAHTIKIRSSFDSNILHKAEMERISRQFRHTVLQLLQSDQQQSLAQLELINPEEKAELMTWNEDCPPIITSCIHTLIEYQFKSRPEAEAVSSWDGTLSYSELDQYSIRLAAHLIELDIIEPDSFIPLCFEKSMWTIVVMLGVLRAGGAFVLVDPTLPAARLKTMFLKLHPKIVLTSGLHFSAAESLLEGLPSPMTLIAVCSRSILSMPVPLRTFRSAKPENAAYVIFTSGSTGTPKGVVMSHGALSSSAVRHGAIMGFGPESRVFQFGSYSFDSCIAEILTTLLYGGCVCVPSEEQRVDDLVGTIQRLEINWAFFTPTVLRLLTPHQLPSLKTLLIGGEAVSQSLVRTWKDHCRVFQVYGPTECCVFCIMSGVKDEGYQSSTIGRTIGSVGWIVHPENPNQLLPIGCPGELLMEGPIVAKEYLNDNIKTKASFLQDLPWLQRNGQSSRFYKTGDIVQYNPDGTFKYIGRKDDQVKYHGQRIELGEIENHARRALQEIIPDETTEVACQIIFPKDKDVDATLALFLCHNTSKAQESRQGATIVAVENSWLSVSRKLLVSLSSSLPKHMVPRVMIPLKVMPVTISGKIDRRELRSHGSTLTVREIASFTGDSHAFRSPTTAIEKLMHGIWMKLLKLVEEDLGLEENFFEVGGDSIKAMQLVILARESGLSLSVASVFSHPKLCDMCSQVTLYQDKTQQIYQPFSMLARDTVPGECWFSELGDCDIKQHLIEDAYPCTALQEGLVALSLKQPGTYIAQHAFLLPSEIDIPRLRMCWDKMVQDTSILRTRVVQTMTSKFIQVVVKERTPWSYANDLKTFLKHDQIRPVTNGSPLSRCAVVKNNDAIPETYLVWTVHHALYDGYSLPLILEQVEKLYNGIILAPWQDRPPAAFHRFIEYTTKAETEKMMSFWSDHLENAQPSQFPSLASASYQPIADSMLQESMPFSWKPKSDITLPTIIRAAWAILLSRYSSSKDIVVGVVSSGRQSDLLGIENVIGPTIATFGLRVLVDDQLSVRGFLQQTQAQYISTIPYEHYGMQNIQKLSTGAKAACGFQNMIIINPMIDVDSHTAKEGFVRLKNDVGTMDRRNFYTHALTAEITVTRTGIDITIDFDGHVLDIKQMRRLLDQFKCILQQMISYKPGALLADIELISPEDKAELGQWNQVAPERMQDTVHGLFQGQVCTHAESEAISSWDGRLSYESLNHMSSQLAERLLSPDFNKGDFVLLLFEKSMWTVVAMLAILKAGGICVALDPTYPTGRLQVILLDTKAKIALVSPRHQKLLHGMVSEVITVEEHMFVPLSRRSHYDLPHIDPSDAAFLVFTSGSTGKPKGIVLSHSAVCSSAHAHGAAIRNGHGSRVLQYAAYTFDVSIGDIFVTLVRGGCICIPSDHDRSFNLAGAINSLNVNQACLTSTVAKQLEPEAVPGLRDMTLGGESLHESLILKWSQNVRLNNIYGPAECSIWCVFNGDLHPGSSATNIGTGVGARTWITDPENPTKLAPVGCVGELLLEGPVLACGYLNDEEKTNKAFVTNLPWASRYIDHDQRFYRTGDLVRYDTTGALHFVGRRDTQIKLRGQRIELGEIEHHMNLLTPSSWDAVVEVAKLESGPSDAMLVAFIGLNQTGLMGETTRILWDSKNSVLEVANKIESNLSKILPQYMMPSIYVPLTAIPQTISGKIDRMTLRQLINSLTAEQLSTLCSVTDKQLPITPIELSMQRVWAKALGSEAALISLGDSFFRLGGDSISATKLVALARQEGISLQVADVFRAPKMVDMCKAATWLTNRHNDELPPFALLGGASERPMLQEEIASLCSVSMAMLEDSYPSTPLQEGLMAVSIRHENTYVAQHITKLSGDVDLQRLRKAWTSLVALTPNLRTRIVQSQNGKMYQAVIDEPAKWQIGGILDSYLKSDKEIAMGLGTQLNRMAIVDDTSGTSYLVWTVHHSMYDGWSIPLIFDKFQDIYSGKSLVKSANFNSFIKYSMRTDPEMARSYWQDQLQNPQYSAFPPLPDAKHSPLAKTNLTTHFQLPKLVCPDITLPSIIRAAWALVCSHYTGRHDVLFGATLTGRNSPVPGIESLIGPVITTVPVRIQIDKEQPIPQFLESIQAHAAAMMPFEHVGLQNISRMSSDADLACKFQSLLLIQPAVKIDDELSVLKLRETYSSSMDFSTFGLTVECSLTPGSIEVTAIFDEKMASQKQVQRILDHFDHVLSQLIFEATNSKKKVCGLSIISSADMEEIKNWNAVLPERVDACIDHEISQVAAASPFVQAVCAWDGNLTYSELDSLSTRLAMYIGGLGVKKGTYIPLCFEKSMWTIIAILAVVKAGAAFVPLEPAQPQKRLDSIVQAVKATVVLCSRQQATRFPGIEVCVVVDWAIKDFPSLQLKNAAKTSPGDPLYVIFTSGTTGKPKGCIIEHAAYASGVKAQRIALSLDSSSRVLNIASYGFDTCIEQILTTLLVGGCVCVPSEQDRDTGIDRAILRLNVNWVDVTPSVVPLLDSNLLPNLKVLVLGGEALNVGNIRTWAHRTRLINAYGQTEASITSTVNSSIDGNTDPNDIGVGVGALCWIVQCEDHNTLVPIGAEGELLIEGPILSRGYMDEPEMTDEVFIYDPKWAQSQSTGSRRRFYKTGDVVQYASSGHIRYLRRKDIQMKIRGVRLEPGEIEHNIRCVLRSASDVVVATIHPGQVPGSDTKPSEILAAFICTEQIGQNKPRYDIEVISQGSILQKATENGSTQNGETQIWSLEDETTVEELQAILSQQLPKMMIPSVYFRMSHIPLTVSGKVDRKCLQNMASRLFPEMLTASTMSSNEEAAAAVIGQNEGLAFELSQQIACIIQPNNNGGEAMLMGRDVVLARSGLDSIKMITLASYIRRQYGVSLSVEYLFDSRLTVRKLAGIINDGQSEEATIQDTRNVDLMHDINRYDMEIVQATGFRKHQQLGEYIHTALLTGATGFLGSQILRSLLNSKSIKKVIVIVRAPTVAAGIERIVESAITAQWWSKSYLPRLEVWKGDLREARLGLSSKCWTQLVEDASDGDPVDAVIHSAASVHWSKDYDSLKPVNVGSTIELLKLATAKEQRMKFIYVTGGLHWSECAGLDDSEIATQLAPHTGYSQTKFVSEVLVKRQAARLGGHASGIHIVRPGFVLGTAQEGVGNTDDYLWRVVAGAVEARGYCEEDENSWIYVSGADRIASAITALLNTFGGEVALNICDGISVQSFWDVLTQELSYDIHPMEHAAWMSVLRKHVNASGNVHPLWPVFHMMESDRSILGGRFPVEPVSAEVETVIKMTVKQNVEYMVSIGFLSGVNGLKAGAEGLGKAFKRSGLD